jgi:biopolymer transport protein ExbB/TolQ
MSEEEIKNSGSCIIRYLSVAFLPTLFLSFIALNYFHILTISNISSEIFYITTVIYFIFLLFIPHNAYIAECKIQSRFNQLTVDLDKTIEHNALIINKQKKAVLNLREFLENYFNDIRNDNFAKIATSTFPMLGILGTFIAIAISMPDFTVTNNKELDNEISKLLSGVGTAFYASIFGIFLSLLWSFFERYGLSKIEKLTQAIEKIYENSIWSEQELLKFQYQQKSLLEQDFAKSFKDVFNIDFIKELNKEHLQSYEKIINQTQTGLEKLEKSLINTTNILSYNISKLNITNNALESQKNIEKNLEQFNKSSRELKELLLSFDDSLDTALIKLDSELAKSVLHIQRMVKTLEELQ